MTHIEPFENIGNLLEDLGMFEAATNAPSTVLPAIDVKSILLALDQSNQDDSARFLAGRLGTLLGASVVEQAALRTAADVEVALRETQASLLVLPVPFGADIGALREDSLGDVVDRLLVGAGVPILAVRHPLDGDTLGTALKRIVVPLSPSESRTATAMAWACRLLQTGGELHALEIADREVLAEANLLRENLQGAGATSQASIERVMMRRFAGLMAVVQRTSNEFGFGASVGYTSGRFVTNTLEAIGQSPGVAIVPGSDDRRSNSYHRCADLILGSTYPVFVV
jgi:hypothetical protein